MNWRFWSKNNPVSQLIVDAQLGAGAVISPKVNLAEQSREGYQKNVAVYACINLIARSCAAVPWVLYQRGATATSKPTKIVTMRTYTKAMTGGSERARKSMDRVEVDSNHPLLRLIEKPNPLQSGAEYLEEVQSYLETNGNSFETWIGPDTGPNQGRPTEMWSLRPDRMRIFGALAGSGKIVGGYEYRAGSGAMRFEPEVVLHQRFFSPLDDFYGLSPIQVAALVIDGDNAASLWNRNLLLNEARPSSMLIVKGSMQEDARTRLQRDLEERYAGPKNAKRPMIIEGDTSWQALSMSPAELDWLAGRAMNRREIAEVFTVPVDFVDPDSHSYASVEQARKALYQEKVCPSLDRRRDNLNNTITMRFGDNLYLDYDRDQIDALHEDAAQLYTGLRQADWLSLNEKREATGYDMYDEKAEGSDGAADKPVALLKPAQVPGAPEDTLNPGGRATTTAPSAPLSGNPEAKSQDLTPMQKKRMAAMEKKLTRVFRRQHKALAAHLKGSL